MNRAPLFAIGILAVTIAGCGSGSPPPRSTAQGPPPTTSSTVAGPPGPTVVLAQKLQADKLGCSGYSDIAHARGSLGPGITDIGNCSLGHLGVFSTTAARDGWVNSQLSTFHMAQCAIGRIWAVCLFPGAPAGKAEVQAALAGVSVS